MSKRDWLQEMWDIIAPHVCHTKGCTYGRDDPSGDYCSCGLATAKVNARKLHDEYLGATAIDTPAKHQFYIGQRVLVYGTMIGTVTFPERGALSSLQFVWIAFPDRSHSQMIHVEHVQRLPNGQL